MRFDDVLLDPAWPASQRLRHRTLAAALLVGRCLSAWTSTYSDAGPRALAMIVDDGPTV